MCASGDMIDTSAPPGRPVAVTISKVEDLASYLHWLPWRGIKSQSSRRFLKMKRIGINTGLAEDEKSQARDEKARKTRGIPRDSLHVLDEF